MSDVRIALYAPDYKEYVHDIVDGLLQFVSEHPNYGLSDFRFHFGDILWSPSPDDVPPWKGRADGVIAFVGGQREIYDWLCRGGVPVVNTSGEQVQNGLPTVYCDAEQMSRVAAHHLIEFDYEYFAFVGYRPSSGSGNRHEAFSRALAGFNKSVISWQLDYPAEGPESDPQEILKYDPWLLKAIQDAPKPLGIFAQNDAYASILSTICRAAKVQVPEDVGILSVGDSHIDRLNQPPLSSIHLPGTQVGYEAMVLLRDLMFAKTSATIRSIPVGDVIVRKSTGSHHVQDHDIQQARQLIKRDACRGIMVTDLIATLKMSRKTFERRFNEVAGHSPGEEIRRVRIERAKELLTNSDLNIARISRMVGFRCCSLFTRFFKERTGITPREYRKRVEATVRS